MKRDDLDKAADAMLMGIYREWAIRQPTREETLRDKVAHEYQAELARERAYARGEYDDCEEEV